MIATPYKNLSEDLKEKDRREVYLRSSVALAEIERLRADAEQYERVIEARLNVIDQLQVENRELQESLTAAYLLGSHKKEQEMATMVKKLEDALVEERARGNHYGMSYEEAMFPDPIERWIINGEIDAPKIYIDRVRDAARDQLVAEGKIGDGDQFSDTAKMGWQVTKERKNALRFSISGEMSPTCSCKYCKDAIATIRFMLTEAGI
jgi:hypothetical protein